MSKNIKRLTLCAMLCVAALTIFIIEAYIPLPLPVPGLKLGLSNIITLFALVYLSPKDAFLILISRILLGTMFSSNPSVLLYSLSGGIVCLLCETLCFRLLGKKFICEISIIGAMVHNIVQILCAVLITKTRAVFFYLPPLLIAAIFTGAFCGLCVKYMIKHIKNGNE